jgi:NO-binding membrane sensor protein with MHYT domain
MLDIRGRGSSSGSGRLWLVSRSDLQQYGQCILVRTACGSTVEKNFNCELVGMLACGLDVRITFDKMLTVVSAVVAILFTFAAFCSGYATEAIENSQAVVTWLKWIRSARQSIRAWFYGHPVADPEVGYIPVAGSDHGDNDRRTVLASTSGHGDDDGEEDEEHPQGEQHVDEEDPVERPSRPTWDRTHTLPVLGTHRFSDDSGETILSPSFEPSPRPLQNPLSRLFGRSSSRPRMEHVVPPETATARSSEESTPLTTSSSDDSNEQPQRSSNSESSGSGDTLTSTLSSRSWSEPLHAGLSREARLRIKAQARDKPMPKFGWKYWLKTYWSSVSVLVGVRAAIWGLAIVFMHYCGMWAMEIPEGRIVWNWGVVILSYVVAFSVCFVGCVAMVHMEVHFGRQVAFSTIASIGTCSMHYTGRLIYTVYSYD